MIVKVHKTHDGRRIIAICDSDLIGKKFEEKGLQLDLRPNFYKGEEKDEKESYELIKTAYIVNAAGEKSINFCIKEKIIEKDNVKKIKKIPYAQCLILQG